MRALIIEDELPASQQLIRLLQSRHPDIEIVGVLESVESAARSLIQLPQPDLIFMDIQIADGLSFELFQQVKISAAVIFTTAYDHYAVQAFRVNAVDYLLKPVEPDELDRAVARVKSGTENKIDFQQLVKSLMPAQYKDRFLVRNGQHFNFVSTQDIAWFRSSEGITQAHTFETKRFFIDQTLEELERLLDPKYYFRVNRHLFIRIEAISKIHPHLNGRLKIETKPNIQDDVFVSRERVADFKAWLGG